MTDPTQARPEMRPPEGGQSSSWPTTTPLRPGSGAGTWLGKLVAYLPAHRWEALTKGLVKPMLRQLKAVPSAAMGVMNFLSLGRAEVARGPVKAGPCPTRVAKTPHSPALILDSPPPGKNNVDGPIERANGALSGQLKPAGPLAQEQRQRLAKYVRERDVPLELLAEGKWFVVPDTRGYAFSRGYTFCRVDKDHNLEEVPFGIMQDGLLRLSGPDQVAPTIQELFHVSDEASFNQRYGQRGNER